MFQGLEEQERVSPLPTWSAPSAPTLDRLEVIRERSRGDVELKPGAEGKLSLLFVVAIAVFTPK